MIAFIVTDTEEKYRGNKAWHDVAHKLGDLAKDSCLVLHYKQANRALFQALNPWAVCHSGCSTKFSDYDILRTQGYRDIVKDYEVPQLGLCGGHQITACIFGSKVGPMRRLRADEPDLAPYRAGYFKEWGVYPIRVLKKDPLFAGCRRVIRAQEYHYAEIKKLGTELILLASSRDCRVQAYKHRTKPVYGTQFHPEHFTDTYPDGKRVLENFFAFARKYGKA